MRKRSSMKALPANADDLTQEEFERHRNTLLKFWRACDQPRCQRAKSCLGADTGKCFDRCWAMWPESEKWWLRAAIKARAAGLGVAAAMKAGNDAALRSLREQAEKEREHLAAAAALAAPPVVPEPPASEPPLPHVRML